MKKLATLLLAAGMIVASAAPASAVDVKVDARQRISFSTQSMGFTGDNVESVQQRLRLGLTMAASERLSGYVQFEAKKNQWGTASSNAGDANITVRQAYIDWIVPATSIKVRMGRQLVGLPVDAFGCNAALDPEWGTRDGIAVSVPVNDWLSFDGLWVRAGSDGTMLDESRNDDVFAAVANLSLEGVSASVYGAYAALDGSYTLEEGKIVRPAGTDGLPMVEGDAYWVGFTSTLSFFDPFTLKLSAAWGEATPNGNYGDQNSMKGWNVQAKASYATSFGTPVLGGWYFSGDDKGDGVLGGTMPTVGGYFIPTTTYHDGAYGINGGQCVYLPVGHWGIQAGIEDVSFVKDLTHHLYINYMQGTNDKDLAKDYNRYFVNSGEYLTEEDSLVELDLVNVYQIYKNFTAFLELSYIWSDFDENVERHSGGTLSENDWRAELTFQYRF